jgi:hypothetical protein
LAVAFEATATASGSDVDVLALAVEAGVLCAEDAVLIRATRLDGVRLCDAARLCGLSYQAAKKRRRRAEVAWATWWGSGAGAFLPSCSPRRWASYSVSTSASCSNGTCT